jgi:hypothetical protein
MGDYDEGLKRYESRNKIKKLDGTLWTGQEDISGKTVYIKAEQGLGDMIQFSRYVPLVSMMGATVCFQVPRPLQGIMKSLGDEFEIVDENGDMASTYYTQPHEPALYIQNKSYIISQQERAIYSSDQVKVELWKKKLNRGERDIK